MTTIRIRKLLRRHGLTYRLDRLLTHRWWGLLIFLAIMFVMFQATFYLGSFPLHAIERGVQQLSIYLSGLLPDSALKSLLIEGVIGGVGGVIVFLPNILILYTFITFIEESGYIDRAAKIMDRVMHLMGLHGRSFVPLIMGLGCNVPAMAATASIESRSSRLITLLVTPFMSCSARLPIYILMAGTFFPQHSGWVLMAIYVLGILVAVLTAHLLRRLLFNANEEPHTQHLRPYKLPTLKLLATETWNKAIDYIRKLGGLILVASVAMWFLSYYPRPTHEHPQAGNEHSQAGNEHSYIARVGKAVSPVFEPLGFGWRTTVSLLVGTAAKELIISTLGVLYAEGSDDEAILSQRLTAPNPVTHAPDFTPPVALSFMVFVLLYFPCVATLGAIAHESGSWRWAFFSLAYSTFVAWVLAFSVYRLALWWI